MYRRFSSEAALSALRGPVAHLEDRQLENAQDWRTIAIGMVIVFVFGHQAWAARPMRTNPHARRGRFTTSVTLIVAGAFLIIGKIRNVPPPLFLMSLLLILFVIGTVWEYRETRAGPTSDETAPPAH